MVFNIRLTKQTKAPIKENPLFTNFKLLVSELPFLKKELNDYNNYYNQIELNYKIQLNQIKEIIIQINSMLKDEDAEFKKTLYDYEKGLIKQIDKLSFQNYLNNSIRNKEMKKRINLYINTIKKIKKDSNISFHIKMFINDFKVLDNSSLNINVSLIKELNLKINNNYINDFNIDSIESFKSYLNNLIKVEYNLEHNKVKEIIPIGSKYLFVNNPKPNAYNSMKFSLFKFLKIKNLNKLEINNPSLVETLSLYNIEQPLTIGSIPSTVKCLYINDGFKHQLSKGIVPDSVESLWLFNIEQQLEVGSIPSSVKHLHILNGFKHKLSKGIIPEGLESLSIYDIEQPLETDSIPSSVKRLYIHNQYKHHINKDIIPKSVELLSLYDIIQPLEIGSIPSTIKSLYILNGFKHQLYKDIIPEGIENLSVYNIEQPLEIGSIPLSVKSLHIHNKYKHTLYKGIIPATIKSLSLHDIEQPLEIGSIPLSVEELNINYGFKHKLSENIIPNSIKSLGIKSNHIRDLTIPNSVSSLELKYKYSKVIEDIRANHSNPHILELTLGPKYYYEIDLRFFPKSTNIHNR